MSKNQQPAIVLADKNECIRVCIRVRPLSTKEVEEGHAAVVEVT
jgi:hypothetical protein